MGCIASEFDTPITLYGSKSPIVANLSQSKKEKIARLIEKDNILELAVAMSELGVSANSEVSDPNIRWMLTHLCCRWDADNCLQYLLKDYFCSNPLNYIDFINAPTSEGYTCLHICAMWKAEKCFYVLHHYGGLNLNAKDKMLKTPYQTANQYAKEGRMKLTLSNYREMNINFTQVEGEKLISGQMIAEDIGSQMKKKQDEKKKQMNQSLVKKTENVNNGVLNMLSDLEKQMIEEKKKLQKQKEEILQSKIKQQVQSDAKKAQLLAENSKKQIEEFQKIQHQKKIKQQIDLELRKQQQKLAADLKAKQDELNKVKDDLKRKEEERILKQKQQAEKKTQQFLKQKQEEINQKVKEKEDALNNLKKQQEERARKQKQEADRKLKQVQDNFNKKEEEMNKKLKQKEQQVLRIKQQQEERLRKEKENTQQLTQQAIKKSQQEYNRKLKEKQEEVRKYKEQQAYRLMKQKQEAERRAVEQAKQANKLVNQTSNHINQNVNEAKNTANTVADNANKIQNTVSNAANQLREAYKKIKEQIPADIEKLYTNAKNAGAFFDSEFPANDKSIGDPSKSNFKNFTTNTIWLRPREILKADFKLFDGIDPNDIKQGSLGVCYMLASLSALAETPKNIQKMFVFSDTSIGFYVLRFYVNGKPKLFVIDDLIPCNKTTKSPLFTKPIGNQIWVLLLQKAWAKLIGDYLSAESMTPDHMMEDLSAAPGFGSWFQKEGKSNAQHIKTIVKHDKMGHIVVITSGQKKIEGIANNHAYTMLQAYQYNGRFIFKVRNPWGQFQWNGQYGDHSSLWTPQLKSLVKYEDKDDGVFHLSENELTNAFCYYSISQINDKNVYSFTQFTSKRHQNLFFTFKLEKAADVNVRVTQLFDRMIRDKSYKYSPFVFEVGKINSDNNVKFLSQGHQKSYFGAKSVHAFENIVESLEAGNYFIRIKMLWQDDTKYNKAVLAIYAPQYINIQRLANDKGTQYMKALFYSQASKLQKNPTGDGFYKISTMKGQFVLIAETDKQGKHQLKSTFTKDKMQMAELDLGKISDTQIQLFFSKTQPGIATAMRTDPAKGGTTGPCTILVQKVG